MSTNENKSSTYLKKAVLKANYRSIKNVEVEFQKGLNIIIGKNGSGKTNLLQLLYNTLSLDYLGTNTFETTLTYQDNFENSYTLKAENENLEYFTTLEKYLDLHQKPKISLAKNENDISLESIDVPLHYFINTELKTDYNFVKHGIAHGLPVIETPLNYSTNKEDIRINDIKFDIYFERDKNALFLRLIMLYLSTPHKNLQDNFSVNTWLNHVKERFDSFFIEIRPLLSKYSIIKDIRLNENINVHIDNSKNEIITSNLVFDYFVNDSWLPFGSLSDGTKRLFLVIANVGFDYNLLHSKNGNTLKLEPNSRIILLEEPELGIHPHQLHLLMLFLKEQSKDKQIIITTHSPQVLDVIGVDELDHVNICSFVPKLGTQLRLMTEDEKVKAKLYMNDGMYLSDYWRFSDFNRD